MPDYGSILDAEIRAFIRETSHFYPPETAAFPVKKQREVYDEMCRAFHAGRPEGVRSQDLTVAQVPLRHYRSGHPDDRANVLYLHGGGFVVGGLESHDDICAELCAETGMDVFSVDYRLCPEHPHPAAFEDAQIALGHARSSGSGRVILVGDSAGGNLAAALSHAERGSGVIAGQVLVYPGLGGDKTQGSYIVHANAPMLTVTDLEFYETVRSGGGEFSIDPRFAPLRDTDFAGLPPTLALGAECDPLADDAPAYAAAVTDAGGEAVGLIESGLVHGHLRARHRSTRVAKSFARILSTIRRMRDGQPLPSDLLSS